MIRLCQKEECCLIETGYWSINQEDKFFRRNQYIKDGEVEQFVKKHNSFGVFTTPYRYNTTNLEEAYLFSDMYLDFDDQDDFERVRIDALRSISYLKTIMHIEPEQLQIYFSGNKGVHVMVPSEILGVEPDKKLNLIYKFIAADIIKHTPNKTLDLVIYDNKRLFRIPGTKHEKTGLHKISITHEELRTLSHKDILELAKQPRIFAAAPPTKNSLANKQYKYLMDLYIEESQKKPTLKGTGNLKYMPPCVKHLLETGAPEGKRNNSIAALSCYYRNSGMDYIPALAAVNEWNYSKNSPPTKEVELERTVRSIYSGHANYGCTTLKVLSECDFSNCKLMKKKQAGVGVK
jgi:hypothetical protein